MDLRLADVDIGDVLRRGSDEGMKALGLVTDDRRQECRYELALC